MPVSGGEEGAEAEGGSQAELKGDTHSVESLQTLPPREAALFPTGTESCRELELPSRVGFWFLSVGNKNAKMLRETVIPSPRSRGILRTSGWSPRGASNPNPPMLWS